MEAVLRLNLESTVAVDMNLLICSLTDNAFDVDLKKNSICIQPNYQYQRAGAHSYEPTT